MSHVDAEQDAYLKRLRVQAHSALYWLTRAMESEDGNGMVLLEVRVQGPSQTGGGYRVIAKAIDDRGNRFIAFGNGADAQTALAELAQRAAQGSLKFREDKPYAPPAAQ
jgi:hypothetical protein